MAANRTVFVARLTGTMCEDMLRKYFTRFGQVADTNVVFDLKTGLSKKYGFVKMRDLASYQKILSYDKHMIGRHRVYVKPKDEVSMETK